MKSITYAGGALVTGDAVTAALIEFVTGLGPDSSQVAVGIPVLQADGTIAMQTLLVGPSLQLLTAEADELASGDENELFAVPDIAPTTYRAAAESAEAAASETQRFNDAISAVDSM